MHKNDFNKPPKKYVMTVEEGEQTTYTNYYLFERWKDLIEECKNYFKTIKGHMKEDNINESDLEEYGLLYKESDFLDSIKTNHEASTYGHEFEAAVVKIKQ